MKINAERPGVGSVVKLVDHALVTQGLDRPLTQIGPVAKSINLFLFLGRLRQAVIDLVQPVRIIPSKGRSGWSGCGLHVTPLTSQQLKRVRKKINSFLTLMQRDHRIRVNRAQFKNRAKCRMGKKIPPELLDCQAIDFDDTASACPSGKRRLCEAFSNWRTRTAGTGRLNR